MVGDIGDLFKNCHPERISRDLLRGCVTCDEQQIPRKGARDDGGEIERGVVVEAALIARYRLS